MTYTANESLRRLCRKHHLTYPDDLRAELLATGSIAVVGPRSGAKWLARNDKQQLLNAFRAIRKSEDRRK